MSEFLLELLAEEIPAGVLASARNDLLTGVARALADQRINGTFFVHSTPRRLILFSRDLPEFQDDHPVEAVGPSVKVAYDADGRPTRAAEGFARGQGVAVEALVTVSTPKGDYVAARKVIEGRPTQDILAEVVPPVVRGMTFPRMMRWGDGRHTWIRPLHSIVALFDGLVVPMEVFGIESGRVTVGHRTLAPGRLVVVGVDDFLAKLRGASVEPDYSRRREALVAAADRLAAEAGGVPSPDPVLVDALAHLVEWPGLVRGGYDASFLDLPDEILVTTMREHQKVLGVRDAAGKLLPSFLAVADQVSDPLGHIVRGNEWVLKARFADARFFWEEDAKVPLEERLERLSHLSFQEKLGDYLMKTGRIQQLAETLCDRLAADEHAGSVLVAARLLKTDLVTDMVREFTDLQGVVGGLYARREGHPEEVWQALYDQYRPASPEDDGPRGVTGAIVALADRLDTLAGFFALGLTPTGSKDPYALRRAALGVVKILLERSWHLDVPLAVKAAALLQPVLPEGPDPVVKELVPFLLDRLRFLLERKGNRFDEIEAVLTTDCSDLADAADRVAALSAVRRREDFAPVCVAFKRVQNILAQASGEELPREVEPALVTEDAERALASDYFQAREVLDELIGARRYQEALSVMASLGPSLDRFFTEVLVLADDQAVRRNRLALLKAMRDQFFRVARFSEIQG